VSDAEKIRRELNRVMGTDVRMASDPMLVVSRLPTGVLPIDVMLDGGIPRGRFIELYGAFSTLKSWVALRALATNQADGQSVALIDTEHSFDPEWASSLGVDLDTLIYHQPLNGEEAVDIAEVLIRNEVDLIVWDSIAATLPRTEERHQLSGQREVQPARMAALMSLACRKLTSANTPNGAAMIWINQTRINVGQMFGNPEQTTGGKSMGFYATYRIRMSRSTSDGEERAVYDSQGRKTKAKLITRQRVKAKVTKSKLSSPDREVGFDWLPTSAQIDETGFIIGEGLAEGLLVKNGTSRYTHVETGESFHGVGKLRTWLDENDAAREILSNQLKGITS
jgi:recombination protein RecA